MQPSDECVPSDSSQPQPSSSRGSFGLEARGGLGVIHRDVLSRQQSSSLPSELPVEAKVFWSRQGTSSAAKLLSKILRVKIVTASQLGTDASLDVHVYALGVLLGTFKFHVVHRLG